ncbi:MAG: hypothetical protein ABI200_02370 [Gaiellales bacterium]
MSDPRPRRRPSRRLLRLLRSAWRYRGQISAHGDLYQTELAVTLRSAITATSPGRRVLNGYARLAKLATIAWIGLLGAGLLIAALLWWRTDHAELALLGLVLVVPAMMLFGLRRIWGMPIDWLTSHDDPTQHVTPSQLPGRLRELASQSRTLANVPRAFADDLDTAADEQDQPALP